MEAVVRVLVQLAVVAAVVEEGYQGQGLKVGYQNQRPSLETEQQ